MTSIGLASVGMAQTRKAIHGTCPSICREPAANAASNSFVGRDVNGEK
jgi:hypothetical protein